ncbi:MAG: cobalamin 5'-phosphate synthase [Collinsella sp. 60_9]|nr:MAG: cobalamin 5'-phosphate synthase [Collinsella sp. 60_9]
MKIAEAIGAAFGTFSRIPVPKSAWTDFGTIHALAAFPLVGLAEGFLMTAWGHVANLLGVPATIVAAVLVALPVAVTGGIHLDGLCDTSDALASWAPRERKLEIMHDPRAGAFGVIGVVVYFILQFSLFTALPLTAGAFLSLLCSLVFSRALSGLAVECWPAARADGMAAGLSPAKKRAATFAAASAAGMVACAQAVGALMAVAGLLALAWYRHVALSRFGGVTGDLAGWFLQWAELAMLAMLVAGGMLL